MILRFIGLLALPFSHIAGASEYKVAVVGKTKNDSFYVQSFEGCMAFAADHPALKCIYDGPQDFQDPRAQSILVKRLINEGIDGLMISVADSGLLTQKALKLAAKKNIPVFTFDSDLLPEHQKHRLAYIGTNNKDFGIALGNYAKKLVGQLNQSSNQFSVCIHSGHYSTPNLNARIEGVRLALSGGRSNDKLSGETGWREHERCPLYSMGKRDNAITQLKFMLDQKQPVINIAVAGFAQFSPDYISALSPYKVKLASNEAIIISADTEQIQLDALKQGLSTINIGQRPFEMGRLTVELMFNYLKDGTRPKQERYYLDFHYCNQNNTEVCTKE